MAEGETSRQRSAPIDYMDHGGGNVLWQLHPQPESDAGFHYDADISLLSQFAAEAEVLYPPCTMLTTLSGTPVEVDVPQDALRTASASSRHSEGGAMGSAPLEEGGKRFLAIDVLPTFV